MARLFTGSRRRTAARREAHGAQESKTAVQPTEYAATFAASSAPHRTVESVLYAQLWSPVTRARLLLAALAFGLALPIAAKPVRQPTMADLAQVWVGGRPTGAEFFRLELDAQGLGLLTVQYLPGRPAVAYRVLKTSLSKYKVEFVVDPIDDEAEPIFLRGEAYPGTLYLNVGGRKGSWKRDIILRTEKSVMAQLKAVTDRASDERNRK